MIKTNPHSNMSEMPKVGIRPVVDGRRGGIREALEDPTMRQAKNVEKLLQESIQYPNGDSIQTVIAPTTIGGIREASETEKFFKKENVTITLTITKSWAYPMETMDQNKETIKGIWGVNCSENPGAVYLAAAEAAHNQKGLPVFSIYGKDVQDIEDTSIPLDVQQKINQYVHAALAVSLMKKTSYLSIGGVSMGIAGCIINEKFFHNYLDMHNEYVDMTEIIRRLELNIFDQEEYLGAKQWVEQFFEQGEDINEKKSQRSKKAKEGDWEISIKMALIVRDLMVGNKQLDRKGFKEESEGHNALIAGFQGQREWTDFMPNGDVMESILNSSFDWNGNREPYIVATENDNLNAVSMLFGHLLTNSAQIFADVRTYWSPEIINQIHNEKLPEQIEKGFIHLTNSGAATLDGTGKQRMNEQPAMKPHWLIDENEINASLAATTWYPAVDFFRGGGFSSQFVTDGDMPVTMIRLNMISGQGPVLQLAEGWTVSLPEDLQSTILKRTNPTWPSTWFVPKLISESNAFKNIYEVMDKWGSNHCSISYGHVGHLLISLASMLRIPVSMHNVEQERIFRPSYWNAFGENNSTAADFNACRALGPLYK